MEQDAPEYPRSLHCARSRQVALDLLETALLAAGQTGRERWQFAVEMATLAASGVGVTTLRELLCTGSIEHAIETTEPASRQRTFRPLRSLTFPSGTCFVLADKAVGRHLPTATLPIIAPAWDPDARALIFGNHVVKRFKVPAAAQEAVLAAFQLQGWPSFIANPLADERNHKTRQQLHNTINALNRNRLYARLRFIGNGSGQTVGWKVDTDAP